MENLNLTSSAVSGVLYNKETQELQLNFRCGHYIYEGVSPEKVEELKKAESVGQFINQNIIKSHTYRKIA